MNIENLKHLAGIVEERDDLTALLGSSENAKASELREILKEINAQDRANLVRDSAVQIKEMITKGQRIRKEQVSEIRAHRAVVSGLITKVEQLQMAEEYGLETMNFIPLAYAMGETGFIPEAMIPTEWVDQWKKKKSAENIQQAKQRTAAKKSTS